MRFHEIHPDDIKLLTIGEKKITALLKTGDVFEETFLSQASVAEALRIWANQEGQLFKDEAAAAGAFKSEALAPNAEA